MGYSRICSILPDDKECVYSCGCCIEWLHKPFLCVREDTLEVLGAGQGIEENVPSDDPEHS